MNVGNVVRDDNTHQVTVLASTQAMVRKMLALAKILAKL